MVYDKTEFILLIFNCYCLEPDFPNLKSHLLHTLSTQHNLPPATATIITDDRLMIESILLTTTVVFSLLGLAH